MKLIKFTHKNLNQNIDHMIDVVRKRKCLLISLDDRRSIYYDMCNGITGFDAVCALECAKQDIVDQLLEDN